MSLIPKKLSSFLFLLSSWEKGLFSFLFSLFSSQRGQSFIELLVAIGIFILTSTAAFLLFFGGQSLSLDSINAQFALDYATEGMEAAQSIRGRSWDELTDGEHGLIFNAGESKWELSGTEDTKEEIFTRKITITTLSDDVKEITTEISWQTDPLRPQTIVLVEQFINWELAQEENENLGGDTGGGGTLPYWTNPRTLGSYNIGQGEATDLDVLNKIVYLTSVHSDAKKDDFFVIDASEVERWGEPTYTIPVSKINTGPGLNAVDVAGGYAYVANDSTTGQLQIIAITGPVIPELKTIFKLESANPPCNTSEKGNAIFYYDQKVYMGTKSATGKEFFIVDVSSPLDPVIVGCKEIGADVNAILVKDDIAYLATSDNSKELLALDISNPASITTRASFDALGSSEDGKSLWLVGNTLYFGRTGTGSHTDHHELHILNVVDLDNIQNLGSLNLDVDVNDLRARDNLVFLATSNPNQEFQVWDISDPANITFWSSYNFPQMATGVDYEDNTVYVSVRSNDALRIITSTQQ